MPNRFFVTEKNKVLFTGEQLRVYIPKRYENRGLIIFGDSLKVFGIFEMEVIDKSLPKGSAFKGMVLPAMLGMTPESIESAERRGVDCFVLTFIKNQSFIDSTTIIKQERLAYLVFMEMVSLGNIPKFLSYDQMAFLFDRVTMATGAKLDMIHSVFELLWGHLFRDSDDTSIKYRNTNMKEPPTFVELRSISESPDSATSSIYGSYPIDGLNASLTRTFEDMSDLENHLRS